MSKYLKRESNVELLRIIACLMVIGTHIKLDTYNGVGQIITGRAFLGCLSGLGVTIFFMITGFFIYSSPKSFKSTLIQTINTIIIPFVAYLFACPIILDYCLGTKSIVQCITDFNVNINNVLQVFTWSNANVSYGGHLWYIFSYVELVLMVPLIKLMCADDEKANKIRHYFIVVGLISKLLVDIQRLGTLEFGIVKLFNPLTMPILISLLGFEIYKKKDVIVGNKKYRSLSLMVLVAGLTCSVLLIRYANLKGVNSTLWSYDSIVPIASAISFAVFIISFKIKSPLVRKTINYVSSNVYCIYLIHMLVITKLYTSGIREKIVQLTIAKNTGFVGDLSYTVLYTMVVFSTSLIVALIIKYMCMLVEFIYSKVKTIYCISKNPDNDEANLKTFVIKWGIRCLLILGVLFVEWLFYYYLYQQRIIVNSEKGRVYEVYSYVSEQESYVSAGNIKQAIAIDTRNGISGIGVRLYYSSLEKETYITMIVRDAGDNEILNEQINIQQLRSGDFWQCFFENDIDDKFVGTVEVQIDGDYENVQLKSLKLDGKKGKMVVDNKASDEVLYLIKNESTGFVKSTSNAYCCLLALLTVLFLVGIFMEEDSKFRYENKNTTA